MGTTVTNRVGHMAIIAGGMGTRLSSVSPDIPKALVPVGGKPVLEHQLMLAAHNGVHDVTIFAGHKAEQIKEFVGDGSRFGLSIGVEIEMEPLGNAGGVIRFLDQLPEDFFVIYGDVMLAVDLSAMAVRHLQSGAEFTTFVHPNDHPFDSDLIEVGPGDWVTGIHPYPHPSGAYYANLVNAALYVVKRESLRNFTDRRKCDFTRDVLPSLIARGVGVLAYRSSEYIKDMGTPERLARVERDLAAGRIDLATGSSRLHPAIFLDRDGTLNVDPGFLATPDALELLHGAGMALRQLRQGGYRLIVVTNQPVIARGEASEDDVAAVHRRLEWDLGKHGAFIDAIYLCPHHPDGGFPGERTELKVPCDCRKPGTALVEQAAREHRLDLTRSWMVGDRTADIEMARRTGLRSVLVGTGSGGRDGQYSAAPDYFAEDIGAAAELILSERAP